MRVSPQRIQSPSRSWQCWLAFCCSLCLDPDTLPNDPVPLLQVFAQRLGSGIPGAAPGGRPLKSWLVDDTVVQ